MKSRRLPQWIPKITSLFLGALAWFLLFAGAVWALGALWFDFPWSGLRGIAATVFALAVILIAVFVRRRAKLGTAMGIGLVALWWASLQARQDRDWKPEVALLPYAEIDGEIVTLHNVRNFEYRAVNDFTPSYETRHFDLRNLRGVDIFINYWGSPYMAHPILSFDFGPDGRVCFSIETRPEKGEAYSALGGIYRRFELICVVADERDVIRLRTNFRKGEDVFLYRLNALRAKQGFMDYIQTVNELHAAPKWYNAVTSNCTTGIRNQRTASERAPWDWRMLVNGLGDQLLYERGAIDRSLPFAELKRVSRINEKAKAADDAPDFSERIREGLPGMGRTR